MFRQAEPSLTRIFGANTYRLGGGTALAAVWQHRHSTDVNLFIGSDLYRSVSMNAERRSKLADALQESLNPASLEIANGFLKMVSAAGELGLYTMPSPLPFMPSKDRVANVAVEIERPVTILGRKLHSRMLSNGVLTIRDLYDIAAASILDPDELKTALGSLADDDKSVLREELARLPSDWPGDPARSGRAVIRAKLPEDLARNPHQCIQIVRQLLADDWTFAKRVSHPPDTGKNPPKPRSGSSWHLT